MTLEHVIRDVRFACRSLLRVPSFSAVAVLTLALGIAGTTLMYALVQGVLLNPLPVRDQDRLVVAWKELRSSGFAHHPFGDVAIEDIARTSQLLESVAGVTYHGGWEWTVAEGGNSTVVKGAPVTGRFFEVLGVVPVLGRSLAPADDVEGAENVIVLSHGLWQRRYGGSPDVIGRRLTLDERPFTVVGVMPPAFDYPLGTEAWRTTRSMPTSAAFGNAARSEIDLIARLRPGVTIEQATGELTALTRQQEQNAHPDAPRGLVPVVTPLADHLASDVRPALLAVFGAVGLVLIIATANVANLVLMRSETRRSEMAVREALGAGRRRIVRQLFVEGLMIAAAAAAAGLLLAWWTFPGLVASMPFGLPRIDSVRIDAGVVAFAAALALFTALLTTLAPALMSLRIDLVSSLRSGPRGTTGTSAQRGRRVLVVSQVALAIVVVATAGLLTRSVVRLQSVDTGLATNRLVFVDLSLPQAIVDGPARHAQVIDALVAEFSAVPALTPVSPVNVAPLSGGWHVPAFTAEGQDHAQAAANPALNLESIHYRYFDTFEMPIVRGRAFTDADRRGMPDVAIVSEDVAAATWPGQDPVGKRLKIGAPDSTERWLTVVGVSGAVRYRDLTGSHATLYLPSAQFIQAARTLAIQTTAPIDLVTSLARERVRAVDATVHVTRVVPFDTLLAVPLARPRFNAFLMSTFGVVALLLSTIGLYAVMATSVRQRDREIGIRVALGATAMTVRRLVFGEALRLTALGVAIGLAGVFTTTHLVRSMLFDVHPLDPLTLAGATFLLMAAAALASYPPLRRALRVDPATILRGD